MDELYQPETYMNLAKQLGHGSFIKQKALKKLMKDSNFNQFLALANSLRNKSAQEDKIEGGKADNKKDSDFPKEQLDKGIEVEKEHTNNPEIAKEIAKDHLEEFKDYYTGLDIMEKVLKQIKED